MTKCTHWHYQHWLTGSGRCMPVNVPMLPKGKGLCFGNASESCKSSHASVQNKASSLFPTGKSKIDWNHLELSTNSLNQPSFLNFSVCGFGCFKVRMVPLEIWISGWLFFPLTSSVIRCTWSHHFQGHQPPYWANEVLVRTSIPLGLVASNPSNCQSIVNLHHPAMFSGQQTTYNMHKIQTTNGLGL